MCLCPDHGLFPLLHALEKGLACWEEAWGGLLLALLPAQKGLGALKPGASQPCPALPLEAESRLYTILALSSYCEILSQEEFEIPSSLMPWSRRWTARRALFSSEEAVESRSSVLQWWKHWTDLNLGSDSVYSWRHLTSLGFNYSGGNSPHNLAIKILLALTAYDPRC